MALKTISKFSSIFFPICPPNPSSDHYPYPNIVWNLKPDTRSMRDSLEKYENKYGSSKAFFDLSQSVKRARTSLKGGELSCLATSSTHLWSVKLGRTLSGKEKFKCQMYPIEKVNLSAFSENTLTTMAGNGMFLPNVGFGLLMHLLCIQP